MSKRLVHTDVELTEEQAEALRAISERDQVTVSELVRRGVDHLLSQVEEARDRQHDERRRRALAAVGQFASGHSDGSERHDEIVANALKP